MKTFILLIALLSAAISAAGTSYPTAPTTGTQYWSIERPASLFTVDTMFGEDSSTILSLYPFRGDKGGKFIMETLPIVGSGSDSLSMLYRVDLYNENKSFVRSIFLDSLTTAVGSAYTLPIGLTAQASYVTIKMKAFGSSLNGGVIILPAGFMTLWKVKTEYISRVSQ